jgi:hypothetical protein
MTYQQLRVQLTLAKAAYKELSITDPRYPGAMAEARRLSDQVKRIEAAIGRNTVDGGHYRPH